MENVDRLSIHQGPGGPVIAVKVIPGASREKVAGVLGDRLKITTSTPAEKGRANLAAAAILAKALGVAARRVTLVSGRSTAAKQFRIGGTSVEQVKALLKEL